MHAVGCEDFIRLALQHDLFWLTSRLHCSLCMPCLAPVNVPSAAVELQIPCLQWTIHCHFTCNVWLSAPKKSIFQPHSATAASIRTLCIQANQSFSTSLAPIHSIPWNAPCDHALRACSRCHQVIGRKAATALTWSTSAPPSQPAQSSPALPRSAPEQLGT